MLRRSDEPRRRTPQRVDGVCNADRVDGISNTVRPLGSYGPSDVMCAVEIEALQGSVILVRGSRSRGSLPVAAVRGGSEHGRSSGLLASAAMATGRVRDRSQTCSLKRRTRPAGEAWCFSRCRAATGGCPPPAHVELAAASHHEPVRNVGAAPASRVCHCRRVEAPVVLVRVRTGNTEGVAGGELLPQSPLHRRRHSAPGRTTGGDQQKPRERTVLGNNLAAAVVELPAQVEPGMCRLPGRSLICVQGRRWWVQLSICQGRIP